IARSNEIIDLHDKQKAYITYGYYRNYHLLIKLICSSFYITFDEQLSNNAKHKQAAKHAIHMLCRRIGFIILLPV
ncbi:hypothetical protein, partial [Vibrio parahaemolyticus]|uniref:hypothetical protein n=1 Tax=Vibrio parahaemolyticus TaxID=670 RepID=UPI0004F2AA6F